MENIDFSQEEPGIFSRLKPHILVLSIACIGLILILYGMMQYFTPRSASNDVVFETEKSEASSVKTKEEDFVVDVSGGVQKPGVYHVTINGRIEDAIKAAGGFSADADTDKIQHSINLAAKLTDGMKIYVPKLGENATRTSDGVVAGASATGIVSINTATSSELEDLPGIGAKTAEKIIAGRPYSSIEELLSKKVVGKSVFEKIKGLISL